MSIITVIMGRPTKDPVMQQSQKTGVEYLSLDIATTQRGADGKEETIYFQCYFNKFLADRLLKAGVKRGTCLQIYGDLTLSAFIYQQGQKQNQPGINANISVKDWDFAIANRETPAAEGNGAQNGTGQNPYPANGTYQSGAPQGGYTGSFQQSPDGYGYPNQNMNGGYYQNAGAFHQVPQEQLPFN